MIRCPDYLISDETEEHGQSERLEALATFQIRLLNHALQCRPLSRSTHSARDSIII